MAANLGVQFPFLRQNSNSTLLTSFGTSTHRTHVISRVHRNIVFSRIGVTWAPRTQVRIASARSQHARRVIRRWPTLRTTALLLCELQLYGSNYWSNNMYNRSETQTEGLAACGFTVTAWRPGACGQFSWFAARQFMQSLVGPSCVWHSDCSKTQEKVRMSTTNQIKQHCANPRKSIASMKTLLSRDRGRDCWRGQPGV